MQPEDVLAILGTAGDEVMLDPARFDIGEVLLDQTQEVRQGWRVWLRDRPRRDA